MFFPLQDSFNGGEISPRMYGRTDTPQYKRGVAYSENWLHLPQGPVRMRGGSEFLINAYQNNPIRLIPFNLQELEDYCAELGPGYIRILDTDGPLPAEGPELVVNGGFNSGLTGWVTHIAAGCQYFSLADIQTLELATWQDQPPDPGPPAKPGHIVPTPGVPSVQQTIAAPAGTYNFTFGFTDEGGFGARVRVHDIGAGIDVYTQTTVGMYVNVAVTLTTGPCYIAFESTAPTGTKGVSIQFAGPISFRSQSGTAALITGMPWTADMLRTIQYAQDIKEGLFLVHPKMTPMQVKYDRVTNLFTCAPVAFTAPSIGTLTHVGTGSVVVLPTGSPLQSVNCIIAIVKGAATLAGGPTMTVSVDGGATNTLVAVPLSGSYSLGQTGVVVTFTGVGTFVEGDVYYFTATGPQTTGFTTGNYPACVEVWQSRLWFANTPTLPSTLWASRTFSYLDFTADAVISESSPFNLTSNTKGAIKWIRGKQSFLLGTDLHEDTIASTTQVISAIDAQLLRQSAYGSTEMQAIDVGDQVLFVSRDNTKIRSLNFNFDTQAWLSHDITWYAQHITLPGVVALAFARDPDNTIYTVLSDGSMRMCTYDRLADSVAWSRMTTQGFVNDCIVTVDPTGATTWLAVFRNQQWMIEIISAYRPLDPTKTQWMDCWQHKIPTVNVLPGPLYTVTVTGLTNLNGLQCGVVVDGVWAGFAVPTAGSITIPWGNPVASSAIVGLMYPVTRMTSLPLNEGVMYGTPQGQKKRRNRVFIRLITSVLPLINGKRPTNQRTPSVPMGVVQPPVVFQDVFVTQLGWDRYAQFTIEQTLPFETDIAAVFGSAEVSQDV